MPLAALLSLLAGIAWACPKGFQRTNVDLCSSEIESSTWEEGRMKCALRGGPSAVLAPSNISSGIVPYEIPLPRWALPKELGMEARSVDECHVKPGCVTMKLSCHKLTSVKTADGSSCDEKVTTNEDVPCDFNDKEKCDMTERRPDKKDDCFKYKEHALQPSMNISLTKYEATVSISNRHLLSDCWCILAELDDSEGKEMLKAAVLSDLQRGSPYPIMFLKSSGAFVRAAFWCQCFDKWTGLILKTDVYSTGICTPKSPSCYQLTVVPGDSRLWCLHSGSCSNTPPEDSQLDIKKAVEKLDLTMRGVATAISNSNDALQDLEKAFKFFPLEKGSNVSFEGGAISALVLPEAIGLKATESELSDVDFGDTPENLAQVTKVRAAVVLPEPQRVALVVYKNHDAFHDGVSSVISPVVEVFAEVRYVDLVLRPWPRDPDRRCAFWDVGTRKWNTSGCHLCFRGQVNDVCHCNHLTTFALIVTDTHFLTPVDEMVLDRVSVVVCVASLLGALGTVVASALCREWRSRRSTLVLLNLTVAVALRDALFVAAALGDSAPARSVCVGVGVALHFAELAAGAWCLVAGVLQVFRFTTLTRFFAVNHLILWCVSMAWPIAGLPVVSLLTVKGLRAYAPAGRFAPGLCFPRESSLMWAVTLPLGIATVINLGIFLFLVWTLCGFSAEARRVKEMRHGGPGLRTKALKCIMLFFLLSVPWVFGVPTGSRFLAYVFCITATPQGLVLFFFFVLGNKSLRSSCRLTLRRNVLNYFESGNSTANYSDTSHIIGH